MLDKHNLLSLQHNLDTGFLVYLVSSFLKIQGVIIIIPPQTVFVGGYTVFALSVHPNEQCVRDVLVP